MAQLDTVKLYRKSSVMIPMRDGIKLYTVILSPVDYTLPAPILIQRTPYGAEPGIENDSTVACTALGEYYGSMLKNGYFLVFQDIRGKYKSEGTMEIHQPLIHNKIKDAVDESTDTYDTVDWLIKNLKGNNGKAGILGISYPGWLALVGAVDPHPAMKAASEQACMADLFLGDDFHHNGAFRLSYGFEYTYGVEFSKTESEFPFPQYDLYDWYLHLGSPANVNTKYFHRQVPTWNHFVDHPNYDSMWQSNSPLNYISHPQIPMLHVGGYFDQEDINGPQLMYRHLESKDTFRRNHVVLGPWNHGQWGRDEAESLGAIHFKSNTAGYFHALQKRWFDYYLKGIGDGQFDEAYCFQTGTNTWKKYSNWPPRDSHMKKIYLTHDLKVSFEKPTTVNSSVSYVSDPSKPVPYRTLPIEMTYGRGSRWGSWQVEDQRFVSTRPDVLSFSSDTLTSDITVTGKIISHLIASTTGTDADWIIKLIDVYPAFDTSEYKMSGYQLPVAMEVFRGKYRKSYAHPSSLVPGKPEEFIVDLHEINHVFLKGHRMMVQVQSSWFPVIDRNPQKFLINTFNARETDYTKATQRVYCNRNLASYIELPIVSN